MSILPAPGPTGELRALLCRRLRGAGERLPPERELAKALGVSRGTLRKALADLEAEGLIWRHVGRGTFIGARPVPTQLDLQEVTRRTGPADVMLARETLEPQLARLAAVHATATDLEAMRACLRETRAAGGWRSYEHWDNQLHRVIASATGNLVLQTLFEGLNAVRRSVTWGRKRRRPEGPAADHHSFAEHDRIVAAIEDRDPNAAELAMLRHLASVQANLLGVRPVDDLPPP
ncbi:MAG: FadR family transcriptional regulator [Geminicoccaceae bacterium]|nr:MAG: FadR family transcriptional regulator [Geminicoccaceae bacterium]